MFAYRLIQQNDSYSPLTSEETPDNRIFYTKLLWFCIFEILPILHDIIHTIFSRQFDILINCALAIRASQNLGLRFLITVTRHSFEKAT